MSQIFAAAVAITSTRRRRFLWAAWWTAPPTRDPFRKPDAAQGGARSRDEARRQAEKAAARPLVEIDGAWARAWARILVGEDPWLAAGRGQAGRRRPGGEAPAASVWQILGIDAAASLEEIKRAFHQRALATHPDHGGDATAFREVRRAYDAAVRKRARARRKARRR